LLPSDFGGSNRAQKSIGLPENSTQTCLSNSYLDFIAKEISPLYLPFDLKFWTPWLSCLGKC